MIKAHNLIDIKTTPRHPESNGIVERFDGTVRAEGDDDYGNNYLQAEAIIAKLMHQYNEERLHATLSYMTPRFGIVGSQTRFETSVHGESLRPVRIVE